MLALALAACGGGDDEGGQGQNGVSRDRMESTTLRILRPVTIAAFLIATLVPFYYMVLLSLRSIDRVILEPGALVVDFDELNLGSYSEALLSVAAGGQGFLAFIRNSGLVATGTVLVTLLVSIPGAYAISRLRFFGRRQVHFLFLAVYLVPAILLAIPLFVLFTRLRLRGSLLGLE